jgi:hypothetical protein
VGGPAAPPAGEPDEGLQRPQRQRRDQRDRRRERHDVARFGLAEQQEVRALAEDVEQRLGDHEAGQRQEVEERPQLATGERSQASPADPVPASGRRVRWTGSQAFHGSVPARRVR